MGKIKVGILLFYLELYDEVMPELRSEFLPLIKGVEEALYKKGFETDTSPVCRLEKEFDRSINDFEKRKVDVILTLHLAYSPSLESIEPVSRTNIPLVIFDTTIKRDLSTKLSPVDVMANHGIHGVQDLCNMLIRKGKRFLIEAGHFQDKKVLARLAKKIRAAAIKSYLSKTRVLSIGGRFEGMGDFCVDEDKLYKDMGVTTVKTGFSEITRLMPPEDDVSIKKEMEQDKERFLIQGLDHSSYISTLRISLALRKMIKEKDIDAFSMNFASIDRDSGFPTLPFLEASKSMSMGIGYAGEGDILTASLVSCLLRFDGETSFVEMFCPDWEKDLILLSHMGEFNIGLAQKKPSLVLKKLPFSELGDPVVAVGQFKEGKAILVDLAPKEKGYVFILSTVQVINIKHGLEDTVTGWIRPQMPVGTFLEKYSRHGGSHHLAMVYGDHLSLLAGFGSLMNFETIIIN